jgi:LPS export ABC transporter protein LptC
MILKHIKSIIITFGMMMLFSCENSLETIREITKEDTLSTVAAYDVIYQRSDSGYQQVLLRSPLMEKFGGDDPYSEFKEGFEVTFYDTSGAKISFISANYGINYEKRGLLKAKNDVIVKNYDTQEQLNTENLIWDKDKKILYTRSFVKITSPENVIFGDSLWAKEDFSYREIYNMRGEIELKEEDEQ